MTAWIVGFPAAALFAAGVCDMRLQNAVSALNAERRLAARTKGWKGRLFGWGLPVGDPMLFALTLVLVSEAVFSADIVGRWPATALCLAACALVIITQIALMARGYPTDRYVGP
jgi:hypothetical protein